MTFAQESLLMTPEKHRRSPSEIGRLINAPLTGLGLQHTHMHNSRCTCVCTGALLLVQYVVRYLCTATCLCEGRQTNII